MPHRYGLETSRARSAYARAAVAVQPKVMGLCARAHRPLAHPSAHSHAQGTQVASTEGYPWAKGTRPWARGQKPQAHAANVPQCHLAIIPATAFTLREVFCCR